MTATWTKRIQELCKTTTSRDPLHVALEPMNEEGFPIAGQAHRGLIAGADDRSGRARFSRRGHGLSPNDASIASSQASELCRSVSRTTYSHIRSLYPSSRPSISPPFGLTPVSQTGFMCAHSLVTVM